MAAVACIAIIFVIKYTFEIKLIKNDTDETTKNTAQTVTTETTSVTASTKADETSVPDETAENETSDVYLDINDIPLNERTYTVNNTVYHNRDLMKPCEYYNSAIVYNAPKYLDIAYPQIVIDYLVTIGHYETVTDYVESLYLGYRSIFDENFFIKNTLEDTTVLNEDDLKNMNSFFKSVFASDFEIEYAVLMKTTCTIQNFGSNSGGFLQSESEDEYFISYFCDNQWYIDYLYADYYFFN